MVMDSLSDDLTMDSLGWRRSPATPRETVDHKPDPCWSDARPGNRPDSRVGIVARRAGKQPEGLSSESDTPVRKCFVEALERMAPHDDGRLCGVGETQSNSRP